MLSDYQALLTSLVRDDTGVITQTDSDRAIQLAVLRYATDFPLVKIADLASNGTSRLPVPNDWVPGFSDIAYIEYPINAVPPSVQDVDQYCLYQDLNSLNVLFTFVPDSTVRLTYSLLHTVTSVADTINVLHREPVTCWAAALCCDQLAAHYASASESTIQADHVQRNSQSADYARLAKDYRARYFSGLAIQQNKQTGASVVVDLDLKNSVGQDRFTHSNRYR